MEMELMVDFINKFILEEYEYFNSFWTEKSKQVFNKKRTNMMKYFACGLRPIENRPITLDKNFFNDGLEEVKNFASRQLFQIKVYEDQYYGRLYRFYLSNNTIVESFSYFMNLFAIEVEHKIVICSRYNICFSCNSLGVIKENRCDECNGFGWKYRGGLKLNINTSPINVYKIKPPKNAYHLEEYNEIT